VQALTLAMIDLDEDRFEKIISTNILQMGFEKTMLQIIYPFLVRIGFLWQTGSINPAQEHFISHLIRQKLIVAIDGQILNTNQNRKKYLLYLPEGELHELALLFASYIIKVRNHKVIYLGQNLPFNDLIEAYKIHNPNYIVSIMTATPFIDGVQNYLDILSNTFNDAQILLSGSQIIGQDWNIKENMMVINKIEDLIQFVEKN
jgi:methanogenic corrinoid protein MtbC1